MTNKLLLVDRFPYGKHGDCVVAEVARVNPSYVLWWNRTVTSYTLDPSVVELARKHWRPRTRPLRYDDRHWSSYETEDFDNREMNDWGDMW